MGPQQKNKNPSSAPAKSEASNKKTRTARPYWIPVVAGILKKGNKILVGRRPDGFMQGVWEFPGGKIEKGEQAEQALKRELFEELGIEVLELSPVQMVRTHTYKDVNILILFFVVSYWKGEVRAKHHLELEWIEPEELLKRPIPEANLKVIDRIFHMLGHQTSTEV